MLVGIVLVRVFEKLNPRATKRTMVVMGTSVLLVRAQELLEGSVPFAALLAVMATGFIILERREHMAHEISAKLGKFWVFASIMLFTLVGAQVDISVAAESGVAGAILIACGLLARSCGVVLCLIRSPLTYAERGFVVASYLPKATVQAAMGAVPLTAMLAAGMPRQPGEVMLAVAVLSILITAPIGAIAIKCIGERVLEPGDSSEHEARDAALESAGRTRE